MTTPNAILFRMFPLKKKLNVRDLASRLIAAAADSAMDLIITVLVTGLTLAYMVATVHPVLFTIVSGYYITAMLVVALIRVVHRFDDQYTMDELAERVIEMESSINDRLDMISRNV